MKRTTSLCLLCLFGIVTNARADDIQEYLYLIEAKTPTKGKESVTVSLTGFKVKGEQGIRTCLHGVASATQIAAIRKSDKNPVRIPMVISKVDVDRDVALLVPAAKDKDFPPGGFSLGVAPELKMWSKKTVHIYGYHTGVDLIAPFAQLQIGEPAVAPLNVLLNPQARTALKERQSPKTTEPFLSVLGPLLPGHSGAPVLDKESCVIAIACGGLDRGRIGYGWAIPYHDIKLVDVTNAEAKASLDRLKTLDVGSVNFCIADETAGLRLQKIETRTQLVSSDGEPILGFSVSPQEGMNYFVKRLQDTIKDIQLGKKSDPIKELEKLSTMMVPLAANTRVEVLEIGAKEKPAAALQIPGLMLPGKKLDGPNIAAMLGQAAEQVNVRVKILEGPHKDKNYWVKREAIKSEVVVTIERDK